MSELAKKTCVPCQGGVPPLSPEKCAELLERLEGWSLNGKGHLEKSYRFDDFRQPFEFAKRVGEMAEEQWHHPDLFLSWGRLTIEVWTHKIDGLVESDFIFAAKADRLLNP
jgi:4a-hydroxytetrahydrobiopterin dehydratase